MRVEWAESARRDFDDAMAFIAAQSPSGARRVGFRILHVVELLATFPELAPPSKHRGLRQLVVSKTPYVVIYRVHEDRVEIRAVMHAKQRRRR